MSILDTLSEARIFSIRSSPDGYEFEEQCDNYFTYTLSPEQLDELINELIALKATKSTVREDK